MLKGLIPANISFSVFAVFANKNFKYPSDYTKWSYGVSTTIGKFKMFSGFGDSVTTVGAGFDICWTFFSFDFGYSYYWYLQKNLVVLVV